MKISYNPKSSLAAITPLTAANDDIIFDLYASKLWAKGIRIGADWADISSKPSSLKNPYALTISLNGTSQGPYDGSAAKNINITPSSIGAATSEHNHDNRYLKLTGGTMQLGEGLKFHADDNYFGTNSDARIISLLNDNGKICDGGLIIDERGTLDGKEYVTELLRIRDSEFKWKGSNILHSGNSNINGSTITINGSSLTVSKSDHTHSWQSITDKLVAGNEFNIVNAGFNNRIWFNYLPINDRSKTATITDYHFGNGHQGYTSIKASGFIKDGSSSRYVLLGDGGHKVESSLNVANAHTVDGFHADSFYKIKSIRSNEDSIYDLRYNCGTYDKGDYRGTYKDEYPTNYGTYLALAYTSNNMGALMFFDTPTSNILGHIYVRTRGAGSHTTYSEWGKLAYITDNVASATKLLTARNLWGNSFDGTKDINDSIVFPNIGDTAISNKISWSSSSDGADIYYLTTGKDLGNLVLNVKDDTNAYILLALNGVFKSHFDVANSYWTGRSALADKWTTARTFTIGNTAKNIDGSGNVSWSLAEIGVNDTWRAVQVNGTSIGNNTLNLCGSTYIGLTNVNGKVTFSLVGSGTTANQAILSNGTANGWTLKTLNIANWDAAYNFVSTITGEDADNVINKWEEIVNFLAGITEDNKLNTLLNSKLSILLLAAKEILTTKTNNALCWVDTKANAQSITTGPFTDNPYALLSVTNYNVKLDNNNNFYRSRLAFSSVGDIKVASCHHENEYKLDDTWYNVLTSKNSGIDGSTIKLNGTSITVYSSDTADSRYVKKTGDTMTGALTINTPNFTSLTIQRNDDTSGATIQFRGKSSIYGYIGLNNSTKDKLFLRWDSDTSKTYTILDTSSTYTSNGKGVINGTTITQVDNATSSGNADKVDGYHATSGNNKPWGTIPVITTLGFMDIGKHLEFHYDNTTGSDYSTILRCTGNYSNIVNLPSASGTLALTSDNVASATKLQTARTIWGQSFDGTGNVSGNMTNVGIINAMLNLTSKSGNAALYLETVTASTDYVHLFVTNSYDKNNVSRPLILQNGYGNVGIGTTVPSYKLHVGGDIYSTKYVRASSGFVKGSLSNDYVLLGGGGHKALSDFSMIHSHPYLPLSGGTLTGTLGKNNNYIFKPNGGDFRTKTNVHTGAICISLPENLGNTMLSMWIDVYNYSYNGSFSVHIGGYTLGSTFAVNPSAMVYGASHKVRLTYDNGFKIYIGEINTTWHYPQISIRDVVLGFHQNYSNWYNDWSVSFVTSFPSINTEITRYTITTDNISSQSVNYATSAGNADTIDGIHANGLFTALSNSNNGISITVGGTTKSITNISVNYANSAGSATKVIVNLNTANDADYPLVWSNLNNANNATENQLFKSWLDLYYNPKNKRLFVRGSVNTANINATGTVISAGFKHSGVTENADLYVLTAGGGYTFLNLASNELAHEFSKDITVTSEWTDIEDFYGGNQNFLTLPGTYIVLVYYNDSSADGMYEGYFSGIMSWFTGTTNSNNADEIVLHRVGHAYANTIYLRTRESLESETNPYTKLQISANTTLKQHTYKFKFKRIC